MSKFQNPFHVDPEKSTLEDRMVAMYAVLNAHQTASKAGCKLPLADHERDFDMDSWNCGTAACAAGSAGLIPWFQTLARSKGISFTEIAAPSYGNPNNVRMFPGGYLNNKEIWEEAKCDMEGLFLGKPEIYEGINDKLNSTHTQVVLGDLTPFEVKQALRRIVIKHFGAEGAKRCDDVDSHCNLLAEPMTD